MRYEIHKVVINAYNKRFLVEKSGDTDNIEEYRKYIQNHYKQLIEKYTTEFFKPTVELDFTDKLIDK